MKRRNFVLFPLSLLPVTGLAQTERWDESADVLVIGGGAGGLSAALSVSSLGSKVILLEKMDLLGGDSLRSGGYFNAVTKKAVHAGSDSVEHFKRQIIDSGAGFSSPLLASVLAERSGESLEWLKAQGIKFLEEPRYIFGGLWKRAYKPLLPSGTGYIQALSERCLKKGVQIRTSCKVTKILTAEGHNEVLGLEVEDHRGISRRIRAYKGVIIASGGFGANKDMLKSRANFTDNVGSDSHPGATGEILLLAEEIGAKLTNMPFVECVPGGDEKASDQVRLDYDPSGIMFVNEKGERFVEETLPRSEIYEAFRKQRVKRCFTIADSATVEQVDLYRRKNLFRGLYSHLTWRKDTLDELAAALNIDAENLKESAEALTKRGKMMTPPYWAVKVSFKVHTTLGGLTIDPHARVLDVNEKPIKNLYACGQVVGNLHGKNRLGGNGINCAVTFGRIAAETIHKAAPI